MEIRVPGLRHAVGAGTLIEHAVHRIQPRPCSGCAARKLQFDRLQFIPWGRRIPKGHKVLIQGQRDARAQIWLTHSTTEPIWTVWEHVDGNLTEAAPPFSDEAAAWAEFQRQMRNPNAVSPA